MNYKKIIIKECKKFLKVYPELLKNDKYKGKYADGLCYSFSYRFNDLERELYLNNRCEIEKLIKYYVEIHPKLVIGWGDYLSEDEEEGSSMFGENGFDEYQVMLRVNLVQFILKTEGIEV